LLLTVGASDRIKVCVCVCGRCIWG